MGHQRTRDVGPAARGASVSDERDWLLDAFIYEVHVSAFADSNGDGTGDFDGLT